MKTRKVLIESIKRRIKPKQLLSGILFLSVLCFVSCDEDLPIPERINKVSVYMQDTDKSPTTKSIDPNEEITFKIGGVACRKETEGDLEVTVEADMSLVSRYNAAVDGFYVGLAEGSYTYSTTLKVPGGAIKSDSITINVKPDGKLEDGVRYLLPLKITSIDGKGRILQNSEVCYAIVNVGDVATFADYDKSGWEVIDFSSEELNGEGPTQGRAALVIDNNTSTFWHSQYTGGVSVAPPHYFAVDMKEEHTFRAFWIMNVQEYWGDGHHAYPTEVVLEISDDGENWTKVIEVAGAITHDKQLFKLPESVTAKYFKIILKKCVLKNGEERTYAYLAEIGISYAIDE